MHKIVKVLLLSGTLIPFATGCKKAVDGDDKFSGDLFTENIRSTEPRTPEEERAGFQLPPGFEIQLFASEPDIDKPINIAFDASGRMWVTQSFEYPFPAAPGKKSTDRLTILEDTDNDGKADRFTDVSDTLNIPIGVLPLVDGVVVFSVPKVYRFSDTNGDDKTEQKKFVLGPFGHQDTHGMVSNFVRGYDGWVHACHGFTNLSMVAGTDGDSIKMISGNTFRFRLDGSRVEQTTFGQVNPFGLVYDEYGYIYSTDSHSSPLHQLINGGDYPHFAKPEIMAFAPDMKPLEDEATALCGIAYYADVMFPKEFQQNFFVGDAFKSRVHRYSWVFNGSSPVGKSETDFVKSADPWFRPVNIKLGPDGALYVADFYNAIIGHYEVPLGHLKRDKQRGRIWRITYKGEHNKNIDLTKASLEELLHALNLDNMTVRMGAADQVADRIGESAVPALHKLLDANETTTRQRVHSLWLLYRLNAISDELLKSAMTNVDPMVRLHAVRILAEDNQDAEVFYPLITEALKDTDPHVQRAAVELLNQYNNLASVEATLNLLHNTPPSDTHLVYTGRLCLRNLLRDEALMKQVARKKWTPEEDGFIAGTLVDVYSPEAAQFLLEYLNANAMAGDKTRLAYQQIARFIPEAQLPEVINAAQDKTDTDVNLRALMFRGIQDGLAQRGYENAKLLDSWATAMAESLLKKYPDLSSADSIVRQQRFAIQLAGDYKVKSAAPVLRNLIQRTSGAIEADVNLKTAALHSLLMIAPEKNIEFAGRIVADSSIDITLRKNAAAALGEIPGPVVIQLLARIKDSPADLETVIVTALAGSSEGKDIIFGQVRSGQIRTRTLIDPRVEERMMLNISDKQEAEFKNLTANVPPVSEERQALIEKRMEAFKQARSTSAAVRAGQEVFNRNCGICHRSMTESGIGPQLHGIGKRGAEAIAEKILDPNRNISEAFRNYTIKLKDGKVLTGLYRREQGEVLVFGDLTGKEFSIPKANIAAQEPSRYTIMPDYFGTTLSQREFNDLLTYVLNW